MSDDIVDRIDALVDWQLAKGEPEPSREVVVLPSPRRYLTTLDLPENIMRDVVAICEAQIRGAVGGVFHAVGLPIPEVQFDE